VKVLNAGNAPYMGKIKIHVTYLWENILEAATWQCSYRLY